MGIASFLIFIGAGLGGICRYWLSKGIYVLLGSQFPYGTFAVNVSGSFLMGLLYVLVIEYVNGIAPQLRSLILIGFLGGYTTFSSFSIETINLVENGIFIKALLNILLSVVGCLGATWLGLVLGRKI